MDTRLFTLIKHLTVLSGELLTAEENQLALW